MGAITKIDLLGDRLIVEPVGWHKVWSLRRRIEVPYADIVSVTQDHRLAENGPSGMRFPGANIPGVYLAGTFWKFWGGVNVRTFWLRRHAENCITIAMRPHSHSRQFDAITVEVDNPQEEIATITATMRDRGFPLADA